MQKDNSSRLIMFSGYRLWPLNSSEISQGINALNEGRADGFHCGENFGFKGGDLSFLREIGGVKALSIGVAYNLNLGGLEKLSGLEALSIQGGVGVPSLKNLNLLRVLYFAVKKDRPFPSNELSKLERITVIDYADESFEVLKRYGSLESVEILGSRKLLSLSGVEHLERLNKLNISYCQNLISIGHLSKIRTLRSLELTNTKKVSGYDAIGVQENLERLIIDKSGPIRNLDFLGSLGRLNHLAILSTKIESNDLSPILEMNSLETVAVDRKREYQPYVDMVREKYGRV